MSNYTNEGQQRILKLINLLAGNEITGLRPGEIAKLQDCSASRVTADLANLQEAGFAEKVPETDAWRLSPLVVQIALRHMVVLDRAERRLTEIRDRFSRGVDEAAIAAARSPK